MSAAQLYRRLLARPLWLIGVLLAGLLLAATQWQDVRFDASAETLVVDGDELFERYLAFREQFADDDFVLVAVRPKQDDLQSPNGLALLARVQQRLDDVPGVTDTLSLLNVPILSAGRDATLAAGDVDITAAFAFLQRQGLFEQQLISAGGDAAAIRVGLASGAERGDATLPALRAAVAPFGSNADIYLGGVPLIAHDMVLFVQRDVQTFAAGIALLMLLVLAWFFRRPRWVVLNLLPAALTCAIGAGLLAAADIPMSVISANSVSLLVIFSISFSIHLVVRYRELLRTEPDLTHRGMVELTMTSKFAPCLFTALTTMVAFLSLTTSGIAPVTDFGWMMAAGVGLGLFVTYLLFPSALVLLPRGTPSSTLGKPIPIVNAMAGLATKRPVPVVAAALILFAAAGFGTSMLGLGGTFSSYFRDGTDVRDGLRFIDNELGGVLPLNVVIELPLPELDPDDPFADPDADNWTRGLDNTTLASLQQLTRALRQRTDVGSATSLADVIDLIAEASPTVRNDAFARSIALSALADGFGNALIRPYVNAEGDQLRISLRMHENHSPAGYAAVVDEVRSLASEAGFAPESVSATGMYVLYGDSLRTLVDSQINTIAAVLIATFVMFLLLLRSLRFAVLGIASNCVAALLVLGFMGWTGLTLDMMTITIAAISIGIGVDDAIHYLHRYREEMNRNGGDCAGAIHASHASIGRAAWFTSCVIAIGFGVLLLSQFVPTATFGLLTAVAMGVAFAANLLLLPALLMLLSGNRSAD